jgi:hypothetical protein
MPAMLTIRADFPTPIPRPGIIGADIEDPLKVTFVSGTRLQGFANQFDQKDPSGSTRRIISVPFDVPFTPEESGQIATIFIAALIRGGVVPADAQFSIVDAP